MEKSIYRYLTDSEIEIAKKLIYLYNNYSEINQLYSYKYNKIFRITHLRASINFMLRNIDNADKYRLKINYNHLYIATELYNRDIGKSVNITINFFDFLEDDDLVFYTDYLEKIRTDKIDNLLN